MDELTHNDLHLVSEAQKGDANALCQLYERYLSPLYRYCYAQCGHRETAEDLTSDVFMKMARRIGSFRGQSSFKNWLYAIAKRTVADYWRQHYRHPLIPLEDYHQNARAMPPLTGTDQEIELLASANESHVKKILSSLPANYRQVLACRFLNNLTIAETAAALHETEANVKVLQHRALKKAAQLFNIL
ncbi:MAG: sigma-70 family RNA polymerase sigma factor [Patescibacteria group bacterium]